MADFRTNYRSSYRGYRAPAAAPSVPTAPSVPSPVGAQTQATAGQQLDGLKSLREVYEKEGFGGVQALYPDWYERPESDRTDLLIRLMHPEEER